MSLQSTELLNGLGQAEQDWHPNALNIPRDLWPRISVIQARETPEELVDEAMTVFTIQGETPVLFDSKNALGNDDEMWANVGRFTEEADAVLLMGAGVVDVTSSSAESLLYKRRVDPLVDAIIAHNNVSRDPIPVFGICLGHQVLHARTGGEVESVKEMAETGTVVVDLTDKGKQNTHLATITKIQRSEGVEVRGGNLATNFGHNDTVTTMGKGWVELGRTQRAPHAITEHPKLGFKSTQGHGEVVDVSRLARRIEMAQFHDPLGTRYRLEFPLYATPGSNLYIASFYNEAAQRAQRKRGRV